MVSIQAPEVRNSGSQYLQSNARTPEIVSPNQELLPLTAKVNSRDCLEIGGCDVTTLVEQFGSPLYILDEETLRTACRQYQDGFKRYYGGEFEVVYASKAWNCMAVCAIAAAEGLAIDVVSGGELYTASVAGVPGEKLYFHGNNKSRDELQLAIAIGSTIMVDNWLELKTLAALSQLPNSESKTRIMLRVTPGIDCHTHEYIRTGHLDNKFGFDPDQMEEVLAFVSQQPTLSCIGLHAHIGSQIFELQAHRDLPEVMVQWFKKAAAMGWPVECINIGGGLGICYTEADDPPSIDEWVKTVSLALKAACETQQVRLPKLMCEPGRSLIGPACVTAYTLGSRKEVPGIRTYLAVDGGMSDNPRPITYQSVYRCVVANRMSDPLTEKVTIAGKHCESGDVLIKDALLPKTETGDILVVMATGAYNYSMASNYNRVPRPAAVLVKDGEANIILQRESYKDITRSDRLPERLRLDEAPVD
jgi:diaminopimelate decarboxylase